MHGVWGYVGCRDWDLGLGIVLRFRDQASGFSFGLAA